MAHHADRMQVLDSEHRNSVDLGHLAAVTYLVGLPDWSVVSMTLTQVAFDLSVEMSIEERLAYPSSTADLMVHSLIAMLAFHRGPFVAGTEGLIYK